MQVSIITASLNAAAWIDAACASVASQTYQNIEHIVVDGASDDNTAERARRYTLDVISEDDNGQSDALNKGVAMSSGEIVTWLNADDEIAGCHVVSHVVDVFRAHPSVDIVYGDYCVIDSQGRRLFTRRQRSFAPDTLLFATNYLVPSAFFRRQVFERVGGFSEDLGFVMDWDFWLRALRANCRFELLPEMMWKHRFHGGSNTVGARVAMVREARTVQARHQGELGHNPNAVFLSHLRGLWCRLRDQFWKLVTRGWVDNLVYSWYMRRAGAERQC